MAKAETRHLQIDVEIPIEKSLGAEERLRQMLHQLVLRREVISWSIAPTQQKDAP